MGKETKERSPYIEDTLKDRAVIFNPGEGQVLKIK